MSKNESTNQQAAPGVTHEVCSKVLDFSSHLIDDLSATPSIGVNGRYVTNPSMTASHDLLDVVDTLVQAEVRESCRGRDPSICPVL